jgi:hypothetical protein
LIPTAEATNGPYLVEWMEDIGFNLQLSALKGFNKEAKLAMPG